MHEQRLDKRSRGTASSNVIVRSNSLAKSNLPSLKVVNDKAINATEANSELGFLASNTISRKIADFLGFTAPSRKLPQGASFSERKADFQDACAQRLMNVAAVAAFGGASFCLLFSLGDLIFGNTLLSFKSAVVSATAGFTTMMMCLCARRIKKYRQNAIDRAWDRLNK